MRKSLLWLAGGLFAFAGSARAIPVVYASLDGTNRGVVEIVEGSGPVTLDLWLAEPDSEIFEYLASFDATTGLALLDFAAAPNADGLVAIEQVFAGGDGGSFALISGSALASVAGPVRIGSLLVDPLASGAELALAVLPGVAAPAYVNPSFDVVPIATPQLVARVAPVPEPRAVASFLAGAALVAFSLRRAIRT
jgi:hypothetical protein